MDCFNEVIIVNAYRIISSLIALSCSISNAFSEENGVKFPQDYKLGRHYTTVNRGDTREELYTSIEAITAAKENRPFPDGTVITMEDYRDNRLFRYIVMEKRDEWEAKSSNSAHAEGWRF